MGWSWQDLQATPLHVIEEAAELMSDTVTEEERQRRASELELRALQSARKARGR